VSIPASLANRKNNGSGLRIANDLIQQKITNSRDALGALPPSPVQDVAGNKLEAILDDLRATPTESIDEFLLTEAKAAYAYFTA
jgi:CRISPR/Cas system-associated endonuclease Cas1